MAIVKVDFVLLIHLGEAVRSAAIVQVKIVLIPFVQQITLVDFV